MTTYDNARTALDQLEAERLYALHRAETAEQALADHMATHVPETPAKTTRIGMSAPANLWQQRLTEVGPEGVTARRIFCTDMSIKGRLEEIGEALRAKMLPVLSFKGTPTPSNVANLRHELEALNADVTATWHHEPRGDWTGPDFCRHSETFLGVRSARVKVGPILNGFLLNNPRTMPEWETFSTPALLDAWDFLGVDLYQREGGTEVPGSQIPKLNAWLKSKGHEGMEIVVGEFNSFLASSIAEACETFISTPNVSTALCWNSTGRPGTQEHIPLEGDRLEAFKAAKRDPRVRQ